MAINTAGFDGPPMRQPMLHPMSDGRTRKRKLMDEDFDLDLEGEFDVELDDFGVAELVESSSEEEPGALAEASEPSTEGGPSAPDTEDLSDNRISKRLASFSPEQRKCMIEYLNLEIQGLISVFKIWDGKDFSAITIAAALEELHEKQRAPQGYSKGRTEETLNLFSENQRSRLQGSVDKSSKKVAVEFRKNKLPSRHADEIDEALLELRALLANPARKLLLT